MLLHDMWQVENDTRLHNLTLTEQTTLDAIALRAQDISRGEEELIPARALMDINKLLTIIGGEYANRARTL